MICLRCFRFGRENCERHADLYIAPARGDVLDAMAALFAVSRGMEETDAELRARVLGVLTNAPAGMFLERT